MRKIDTDRGHECAAVWRTAVQRRERRGKEEEEEQEDQQEEEVSEYKR